MWEHTGGTLADQHFTYQTQANLILVLCLPVAQPKAMEPASSFLVGTPSLFSKYSSKVEQNDFDILSISGVGNHARSLGECPLSHDSTMVFYWDDDANTARRYYKSCSTPFSHHRKHYFLD